MGRQNRNQYIKYLEKTSCGPGPAAYNPLRALKKVEDKEKKRDKKKKFKDEFGLEEEAFNDFFRIGIAFNGTRNTSNANL